jgi:hypothetical protein
LVPPGLRHARSRTGKTLARRTTSVQPRTQPQQYAWPAAGGFRRLFRAAPAVTTRGCSR